MKVVLQGYLCDANFGDMLAADLFYRRCLKNGFEEVDFIQHPYYGIGEYCREQIGYHKQACVLSFLCSDVLVILSGGSFWNEKNRRGDAKIRFRRFILPALAYLLLRKPVYVLGVGGGPVDTLWLRKLMVWTLNRAKIVTFRDEYTKQVFSKYGTRDDIRVTADTMLNINHAMLRRLYEKDLLDKAANGRKKILLHLPDGYAPVTLISKHIVPAIIKFFDHHQDFFLVLSNDNIRNLGGEELEQTNRIRRMLTDAGIEFYFYQYHDCWQMCSLIEEMSSVVTAKLHVGAIASALDKCVIAFPVHREKTDNFYNMIGESDRCINMRFVDSKIAYQQMEKFYDKPVRISDNIRRRAEENLAVLDDIVSF